MIAVMQGRLLPPSGGAIQAFPADRWTAEFPLAAQLGLDAIEWIVDDVPGNPLWDARDVAGVLAVIHTTGVSVRSVCADLFMQRFFLADADADQRRLAASALLELFDVVAPLGVSRIVLPFVDASALVDEDHLVRAGAALEQLVAPAREHGIELHLETSLDPSGFARLLDGLDADVVKVNYDIGNSASLGYRPAEEFAAYGSRIGSVHIKDRRLQGSTVPLGTGDADFAEVFRQLAAASYGGDFVLQAARGHSGDESAHVASCLTFLAGLLATAFPIPVAG